MTVDINTLIKSPSSIVFRRAYIKRRNSSDGLFESDWFDISKDVKSYGKITNQIDSARRYKFTFGNAKLSMENSSGRYNPHNDLGSLWYGYLNQHCVYLSNLAVDIIQQTQYNQHLLYGNIDKIVDF